MLLSPPSATSATTEYCPGAEFVQVKSSVAIRRRISSHPSSSSRSATGLGERRLPRQAHAEPQPQSPCRPSAANTNSSAADGALPVLRASPTVMHSPSIASPTALAEEVDSIQNSHDRSSRCSSISASSSSSSSSWHDAAGDHSSCGCCRRAERHAVDDSRSSSAAAALPCTAPAESTLLTCTRRLTSRPALATAFNAGEIPSTPCRLSELREPAGPGPPLLPLTEAAERPVSLGARTGAVREATSTDSVQTSVPLHQQSQMAAVAAAVCHVAVDYCCQSPAADLAQCTRESPARLRGHCSACSGEADLASAAVACVRCLPADVEANRSEVELLLEGCSYSVRRRPLLPPQLEFRQPAGDSMGNKLQPNLVTSSQNTLSQLSSSNNDNKNYNNDKNERCCSPLSAATVSFPPPPSTPPSDEDDEQRASTSACDECSQSDASFEDAFDDFEMMTSPHSMDSSAVWQSADHEPVILAAAAAADAPVGVFTPITKADQSSEHAKHSLPVTPVKTCQQKAVDFDSKLVADAVHQPLCNNPTSTSGVQPCEKFTVSSDATDVPSTCVRPDGKSRLELARLRLTLDLNDSRLPWEAYNPARRLAQLVPSSPVAECCGTDPDCQNRPQQQQSHRQGHHHSWFSSLPNTRKAKSAEPPSTRYLNTPGESRHGRSCSTSAPEAKQAEGNAGHGNADSADQQPLPRSPTLLDELHKRYYGCQKLSPVATAAAEGDSNNGVVCGSSIGSVSSESNCSPAIHSCSSNNATATQPSRLQCELPTIVLLSPSDPNEPSLATVDETIVAANCPTTASASSGKGRMHMFGDVDKMFRSVRTGQVPLPSTSPSLSRANSPSVAAPRSWRAQSPAALATAEDAFGATRSPEGQPKTSHVTGSVASRLTPSAPKLNAGGSSDSGSGVETMALSGARSRVAKLTRAFSLSPQILRRKYRSNAAPVAGAAVDDLQAGVAVSSVTTAAAGAAAGAGSQGKQEHHGSSLPTAVGKKKAQETEVLEVCNWLADVGFPQYLQLFEEGHFPLELSAVEKDHAFLEPRLLQCLFRRLAVLNRCAHMKLELNNRKPFLTQPEVNVEADQQHCALSDKWRINPKTGRWHRLGDSGTDDCSNSAAETVGVGRAALTSGMRCNDPLLVAGTRSELAAGDTSAAVAAASASTGSTAAATLPGYRKPKALATGSASTTSGLAAVRPSTLLRSLGGSLRSVRKPRARPPLPASEAGALSPADISGPVLLTSAETDERLRRLGCVDVGEAAASSATARANSFRAGANHPAFGKLGGSGAPTGTSSDDTLNNNNINSSPCRHHHKPAADRSGWLVCPDDEDCRCHASLPGCVTAYLLPADYVPGTFPRALTKAVSLPAGCNTIGFDTPASSMSQLPQALPAARDSSRVVQQPGRRSSPVRPASPWVSANRYSVYDNVPTSASALSAAAAAAVLVGCSEEVGQLELALRELLELDRSSGDRQPSASPSPPQDRRRSSCSSSEDVAAAEKRGTPEKLEAATLLGPSASGPSLCGLAALTPTSECGAATGEGCVVKKEDAASAAVGAHTAESRNDAGIELDLVSASSSSNHEGTSDQEVPGSKEDLSSSSSPDAVAWHRERRDSGVGSSLTREPSEGKKKPRLRWHSFVKSHRPSMNSENQHVACLPAGQLMVLQKLCKLYISSVLDEHCPPSAILQHGTVTSILQLPKFGKRARAPDYASKQVFGVPLSVVQQRSGQPLPQCILHAMRYLRKNATDSVGIFRKSGVKSRIEKLHDDLEAKPDTTDFEGLQAYDVADLLKKYFRELPECLLTNQLSHTFLAIQQCLPSQQRLEAMQACVLLLPCENREVLEALLCFLSDMAAHSDENQMTASNLAVCFAPSLFDVCSRRGGSPMDSKATGRSGIAVASNKMALPDQKELLDQKVAHECLALMIANCRNLFKVPEDFLAQCHCSYMEAADPLPLSVLSPDYQSHTESCVQGLLKESNEGFKNWDRFEQSVCTSTTVELWSKKVGDGNPLRLWRATVEIEAAPADVLERLLRERHLWDEDFSMWRTIDKLDDSTDVFHYACNAVPPQPQRDYVELRSWRTELPGGACVMVSHSVDCPGAQSPGGGDGTVRGVVLASSYLIEPCGTNRSRLTHVSRVDMRGRTPDWYSRQYGHLEAACLLRLCDTFRCRQASIGPVTSAAVSTPALCSGLAAASVCSSTAAVSGTATAVCTFSEVPETSV